MTWLKSVLVHWSSQADEACRAVGCFPLGRRCEMVMMIGFVTMGTLVWVLATCMARESDAAKRRGSAVPAPYIAAGKEAKKAA